MTVESSPKLEGIFVRNRLPWIVGAAALAVYLVTLNSWISLSNLPWVIRASGWDWQATIMQPVQGLVTWLVRLLPAGWAPLALNAFTALCASLTLALLARTVALLPHDRTEQQRLVVTNPQALLSLPSAWVPIFLASVALGLQLTFWEHATNASGEMLDLLLFAYAIRCLLEHRVSQRQTWLDRAAISFGVAMANNWAMFGFLPLFVFAVLRTKRLSFLRVDAIQRFEFNGWEGAQAALKADLHFFLRMALLGLAGLSLFLLLPLLQGFSPNSPFSFWKALQTAVASDKETLRLLVRVLLREHRELALLLAATSLLPILLLSIRWGAFAGPDIHRQFDPASLILHLSHAFLLMICLWTVFDPPFSPRQIARQNGMLLPFLPLYYLTAVSIGYYSGFLLLLFGPAMLPHVARRFTIRRALCWAVPCLFYVLGALAVAGLLLENLPAIRAHNTPLFARYARLAAKTLPPEGGVLYSDDPVRLAVVHAALAREGKAEKYVPVVAAQLPLASYRDWLSRKYRGRWPETQTQARLAGIGEAVEANATLEPEEVAQLLFRVAQSSHVYCLQASVGSLLELFYLKPHGLVQEYQLYPPDTLTEPPLTPTALAENQAFWQSAIESDIKPALRLVSLAELPRPGFEAKLMKTAHLNTRPPAEAKVLAFWYSAALNRWGVKLQRNGLPKEATPYFALACDLNADNLSARLNLQCNSNLLAHQKMKIVHNDLDLEASARGRNWTGVLAADGPIDDPSYCFRLGLAFARAGLVREACLHLERARVLAPGDLSVLLALGDLYSAGYNPARALDIAANIRADSDLRPLGLTNEVQVALMEAKAYLATTNKLMAQAVINTLLFAHPGDAFVAEQAASGYAEYKDYPDALRVINRQLERTPEDPVSLAAKGRICVLAGDYSNAVALLTRALSRTNSYAGLFARALAYQHMGRLDEAQADYERILSAFPDASRAYCGLAEVALLRKDTNAAIRYFDQYLAKGEGDPQEIRAVKARLKFLRQSR